MEWKMKINKIAIGNESEAFIESNLSEGVNLIFSDENNKGKTLVIQGLMYSIGNEPIFPSGFDYENYYFYTNLTIDDSDFEFLRKGRTIIVKTNDKFQIFETLSELKYYINKNIFSIPPINKKGENKLADLMLFYQLFFIGQDKRDTSNIINKGYYNKEDFMNMLYSLNGTLNTYSENDDIQNYKEELKQKKEEIETFKKILKFNKENPGVAQFAQKSKDMENFEKKSKIFKKIQEGISDFKKKRSRELNRKTKLEYLITELKSLNQNIDIGKVICAKCGSTNILFSNKDINFDISNKMTRKKILESIEEQISMKTEIINEYTKNINLEQEMLNRELKDLPVEIKKLLINQYDILSEEEYDNKIKNLMDEINELKNIIKHSLKSNEELKAKNKEMKQKIIDRMNYYYKKVDPNGNLVFDSLFTKKDETYSGSEEQEFYFSKLLAINDYFKHKFPIVIDSFRDGELSSKKEKIMLEEYKKLNKQVILTATLKEEEYSNIKYEEIEGISSINYSDIKESKLLQKSYVENFKEILNDFKILS